MDYYIYSFFDLEQKIFKVKNLNEIISIFLSYSIRGVFSIECILSKNYNLKKARIHQTRDVLKVIGRKIHKNLIINTDSLLNEVSKRYGKN